MHQARRAVPVAAPAGQASPAMAEAELVAELERAKVPAQRFGGGFRQVEGDLQGQLDELRARATPWRRSVRGWFHLSLMT